MARISGLASEHHPQGPGDAHRRKKGRKRAASPPPAVPQVKRTRLDDDDTHDDDESTQDQLARELRDAVSRSQSHDDGAGIVAYPSIRRHSDPLVAAQDAPEDSQVTPPPPSTAPLAGRPNPVRRASGVRRARMSMPAQLHHVDEEFEDSKGQRFQFRPLKAVIDSRIRRRLRRSHLSQEVNNIEQHEKEDRKLRKQFAELKALLQEKDNAIKDLEYQLEAQRIGNITMSEDRVQELEQQLNQTKDEMDQLRRSSLYNGDSREPSAFEDIMEEYDDGEDNDLMLIDVDDSDGPAPVETAPLVNGIYAQRALELSSQVTVHSLATISQTQYDSLADPSQVDSSSPVPDKISDKAVSRYENEIERLIQQLSESQGALRVVAIELQNLNVLPPGASTNVIISALRHSFDALREELENLIPKCTLGLTNSDLLRKIPQLFEGALTELREKVIAAETHHQNEKMLQRQYEHVIDLLARSTESIGSLEENVAELTQENEIKQNDVDDLSEQVTTLNEQLDTQDNVIQNQSAELNDLKVEIADKETSLGRLRDSLENYRDEVNKLTTTVTDLEETHRHTLIDLEEAHATAINNLQTSLEEQIEGRTIAENDALDKKAYIEDLEESVTRMENEFETLRSELDQLRQRLSEETELRQEVEGERDTQADMAYNRANIIENLEEAFSDVEKQLAAKKELLESERAKLAETEDRLHGAEDEIAQLEEQLHNSGVQANELRSKLFQLQQDKEETIIRLEDDAREQAEADQDALQEEAQKRETAEAEVASLTTKVEGLQGEIDALERGMEGLRNDLADLEENRDNHVTTLDTQLADLRNKYAALENSTNSTITTLQANITDLTNEVNAQAAELERVRAAAAENETMLREEIAEKADTITVLETDLADAQAKNVQLERENKSLSERVEEEASEMLRISDLHHQESTALRAAIKTHEATIVNLQNAATAREKAHVELIAEKELEIQGLQVIGDTRAAAIVELESQIDVIKETFAAAEEDTRNTIDALVETQRQLQLQNQDLAHALKRRNADAVKAVKEMKVAGVAVRTNGVKGDLHRVVGGKIGKVSEKVKVGKKVNGRGKKEKIAKRQWDSGFHEAVVDDDEGLVDGEDDGLVVV
ncbi:unnamed protein product [Periconia digitata]|uniref:Uncharacterized protein n=1 Tax=Periconia digitata TaxID=1303443 RepID=A0A9W4UK55_9PLEO|nr:unnamed protein product [Periconia digitata]